MSRLRTALAAAAIAATAIVAPAAAEAPSATAEAHHNGSTQVRNSVYSLRLITFYNTNGNNIVLDPGEQTCCYLNRSLDFYAHSEYDYIISSRECGCSVVVTATGRQSVPSFRTTNHLTFRVVRNR